MRWLCSILLLSACSFSGGGNLALDGGASDAANPIDASGGDAALEFGPWSPPVLIQINGVPVMASFDDPQMLAGGLLLFSISLNTDQEPNIGEFDPAMAEIDNVNPVSGSNFPSNLTTPWISDDQLTFAFSEVNPDGELFYATRANTGTSFNSPTTDEFVNISSAGNEALGTVTQNLLTLVYSQGSASRNLFIASRANDTVPFSQGTAIASVEDSGFDDESPRMTNDGLAIVFNRRQPGVGNSDLFIIRRGNRSAEFGPAVPLDELNMAESNESDPSISNDMQHIVFASDRGGSALRLYYSQRSPL